MARIFSEGFEMGDINGLNYSTGFSIDSTNKRSGQYSARGYNAYGRANVNNKSEIYVRVAAMPRQESYRGRVGIRFRTASVLIDIYQPWDNGPLRLKIGSSDVQTGSINLNTNNWWLIEAHVKIDDVNGQVRVRINGVEDINYSGDTKPTTDTYISYFEFYVSAGTLRNTQYDDIAINDTSGTEDNSWCGDGHIIRIAPNGNGDNSDFKGSDGDYTNNYALVDERPYDTGTFVVGENVGDYDLYNFAASGLPAEQIIKRVWVEATAKDPESGDVSLLVKSGTTLSEDSADQTLGSSYGRIKSDEYTTNPDTGAEWTEAELDAIQAGMKVKS